MLVPRFAWGLSATISINASSQVNGFVPYQAFGSNLDHGQYLSVYQGVSPEVQQSGISVLRYPGGSGSDHYHWNGNGSWVNSIWVPLSTTASQGFNDNPLNNGTSAADESNLTDGLTGTAWVSNADTDFPDAQWAYFDLGSAQTVNQVQIWWGTPYAATFQVQYWDPTAANQWGPYQDTASHWLATSAGTVAGTGGQQTVNFTAVSSRYIRVLLTSSSAPTGDYAIDEVEIFDGATQLSVNTNSQSSQTQATVSSCTVTSQATGEGVFSFDEFMSYCDSFSPAATPIITVNFGTGTPQEAAAWVYYANVVKGYHVKYWEIGNEMMGNWEAGGPLSATDYGRRFLEYWQAMTAVDPTIKLIGPVSGPVDPSNNYNTDSFPQDFVQRLISGGEPGALGGLSLHVYASSNDDSDTDLFATPASWAGWGSDVANDVSGLSNASTLPVFMTEYNANSAGTNITVRLSNGIWLVNWLGQYLTQFGARSWTTFFDLIGSGSEESSTTGGNFGEFEGTPGPYENQPFASYWAIQMLAQDWSIPADTRTHELVSCVSSASNLVAYADQRPDGVLSLIVANQDPSNTYTASLSISGFSPQASAPEYTLSASQYSWETSTLPYHVTPDGPPAETTLSGVSTAFSASFAPYSITCLQFLPQGSPTPSPSSTPMASATPSPTASWTPTACPTACATLICYNGETGTGNVDLADGNYYTTYASVSEDAAAGYNTPKGLDITYSFNNYWGDFTNNFANYYAPNAFNLSNYSGMEFWVRTTADTLNYLYVGLTDASSDNTPFYSVGVDSYLPGGVTPTWQKVYIPMSAFTGVNLSQIEAYSFYIGSVQSAYIEVYVDDITFVQHCATPTPSDTATPSPSASPTPSPSRSPSDTPTATPSLTASPTATESSTPTLTATPSPTASPTESSTPTLTETASPSVTLSPTATQTTNPAWSPTDSPTTSPTWSVSPTFSASPTPSATPSASPSATPTESPTPTLTSTSTASPSVSASPSLTESVTPSATPSPTGSSTPTLTATPSFTATPSATPSASPSAASTSTSTGTPTPTLTATPTATAPATLTATPVQSASASASPTLNPGSGPLGVTRFVGVPNPDPTSLAFDLSGPADSVEVRVYDKALVRAATLTFNGPFPAGWVEAPLPAGWSSRLGSGLYYAVAVAYRGSVSSLGGTSTKLFVLR